MSKNLLKHQGRKTICFTGSCNPAFKDLGAVQRKEKKTMLILFTLNLFEIFRDIKTLFCQKILDMLEKIITKQNLVRIFSC